MAAVWGLAESERSPRISQVQAVGTITGALTVLLGVFFLVLGRFLAPFGFGSVVPLPVASATLSVDLARGLVVSAGHVTENFMRSLPIRSLRRDSSWPVGV